MYFVNQIKPPKWIVSCLAIPFFKVGTLIPRQGFSTTRIGFIQLIQRLIKNKFLWMLFHRPDLIHWTKHPNIIDTAAIKWANRAMWAPSAIEKDGKYYLFFGANDMQKGYPGGIGIGVSNSPEGPFKDYLGKPLIDTFYNGAQPIDQFVF